MPERDHFSERTRDRFNALDVSRQSDVVKSPRDPEFLRQFVYENDLDSEAADELSEYVKYQTSLILAEQFQRIIAFFKECKLPKLVVMAVIASNEGRSTDEGGKNMVEIAKQCGVSKQAVHKCFRSMEPVFKKYGRFDTRRRQFTQKPALNGHNQEIKNGNGSASFA